jgi:hypothetical protein
MPGAKYLTTNDEISIQIERLHMPKFRDPEVRKLIIKKSPSVTGGTFT